MRPYHLLLFLFMIASCTKYEEGIISGNVAPPDPTVSSNVYEDYINRTFIIAMGREPSTAEFTTNYDLIYNNRLSSASRSQFADNVFANSDYRLHAYEETRNELLRDNDSLDMLTLIAVLNGLLIDSTNLASFPQIIFERDRMLLTLESKSLFMAGTINMKEVHKRLANNLIFDQINMGTQNFVLAVFQQLVNREPTQYELASSVAMVDGNNSILFLQTGNSKNNFLDIVIGSLNYHEGQVFQLYEKYLLRPPGTIEMYNGTQTYYLNNNYEKIQKDIITTNEFIGI